MLTLISYHLDAMPSENYSSQINLSVNTVSIIDPPVHAQSSHNLIFHKIKRVSTLQLDAQKEGPTPLLSFEDNEGNLEIVGLEEKVCNDLSIPEITIYYDCISENIDLSMTEDTMQLQCTDEVIVRRMWTAKDECGNQTEVTQYISIYDHSAPELILSHELQEILLAEDKFSLKEQVSSELLEKVGWNSVLGKDLCTNEIYEPEFTENAYTVESQKGISPVKKVIYRWTVEDVCGNEASVQTSITLSED